MTYELILAKNEADEMIFGVNVTYFNKTDGYLIKVSNIRCSTTKRIAETINRALFQYSCFQVYFNPISFLNMVKEYMRNLPVIIEIRKVPEDLMRLHNSSN